MQKFAVYGTMTAKPGKEQEVEAFMTSARALAEEETGTIRWFALKGEGNMFGVFDTFDTEEDREKHLTGKIAEALMAKADEFFSGPPQLHKIQILAEK